MILMEKLDKAREEICCDCIDGIDIENCRQCLFNVLKYNEKKETTNES